MRGFEGRIAACDVVVSDVDGCLSRGHALVRLALSTAVVAASGCARRPCRSAHVFRLGWAGLRLCLVRAGGVAGEAANGAMLHLFSKGYRGVSESLYRTAVERIVRGLVHPAAAACVRLLAARAPVGLVSLGLDLTVGSVDVEAASPGGPSPVAFRNSNRSAWAGGRFLAVAAPLATSPTDKIRLLEEAYPRARECVPLVIGHGRDESALCDLARERGGFSVGFGAGAACRGQFDLNLPPGGWGQLSEVALAPSRTNAPGG